MDEFAQTRGVDDLFDDDIVPVTAQAEEVTGEEEVYNDMVMQNSPTEAIPAAASHGNNRTPNQPLPYRKRGNGRGRGYEDRGRGRGRGRGSGRGGRPAEFAKPAGQEKSETSTASPPPAATDDPAPLPDDENKSATANEGDGDAEAEDNNDQSKQSGTPKVYAVRGDRSGTGGVRKPKLTEDELSERMAAVKIKAQERAAAHARAEADEASFLERERVAQKKQRKERENRRVMIGEREQNRQRKLNAQTGREWDAEKPEDTLPGRGRGSEFRRGMHGGIAFESSRQREGAAPEEDWESERRYGHPRGRGRGRRGGRGRGGGPRGEESGNGTQEATSVEAPTASPSFNTESDFPSLPGGRDLEEQKPSVPESSPITPIGTWADQMESSSTPAQPAGEGETKINW